MLLTTFALPGATLATPDLLNGASGLLVPHDGQPVADVSQRPDRWATLQLLTGAIRREIPVLAWGSGAALAGRALGAKVHSGVPPGLLEWAELPRGAVALAWRGDLPVDWPLHWTHGRITAWADPTLPEALRQEFLRSLPLLTSRRAASPLEEVGGKAVLRELLADFYARARRDDLLGPVFEAQVSDWTEHLERVSAFWATMLGGPEPGQRGWKGNLNTSHAGLGIRGAHLRRWLDLFRATTHDHLPPAQADVLLRRAEQMALRLGNSKSGLKK